MKVEEGKDVMDLNEGDLALCSRVEEYMQEIKGTRWIVTESAKI